MQEVTADATARGEYTRTMFVENMAGRLVECEELQDWTPSYYDGRGQRRRVIGLDGYSAEDLELDGTLQVIIADCSEAGEVVTLGTSEVNGTFNRAVQFVQEARAGRLQDLEPSTPAADLARLIFESGEAIRTVRVLLVSNRLLASRYKETQRETIGTTKVELQIWDLERFAQLAAAGGHEELNIDVTAILPDGLAALPAGIGDTGYGAYLCVVPGRFLARIYDEYGSRLLEGNVRAFLSARGKVNQSIRKTIINQPESFFAFNNGITATAVDIDMSPQGRITRIRDLQIVNGGQTTACLYSVTDREAPGLDRVFVQMKLSVLPRELASTMVPDIARYANTQNKVSDADLFANHPFHRKAEEISRKLWAPPRPGSHQMTRWFYERARAQYQTEMFKLTPGEKKVFLLQNPKAQVITKTDLAKYEHSWRQLPHLVSLGPQKNFSKYAEVVREEFDQHPSAFNERWYQHLVAKALVFAATERVVSDSSWFQGDYRPNIVTYAIARFAHLIGDKFPGWTLDLDQIWKAQRVAEVVVAQLERTAEAAFRLLVPPPAPMSIVGEWAKKELCWQRLKATPIAPIEGLDDALREVDEERGDARRAREQAREDVGIGAQAEVIALARAGYWERALAAPGTRRILSGVEFGVLQTAVARGPGWVPTEHQARRLMGAKAKLER